MVRYIIMIKQDNKYQQVFMSDFKDLHKVRWKAQSYFNKDLDTYIKSISETSTHIYKVEKRQRRSDFYKDNITLKQIY